MDNEFNHMNAIVYTQYGPPDVLQLKEVTKPIPKDDEVLARVRATSVNRTDCANLTAKPFIMRFSLGFFKPDKQILGTESVGKDVTSFKVGDKVFGFDDSVLSSYAEYMVISENNALATMPKDITYEQAAGCIEGAHYAYNFINKVDLKSGDKVCVNGASGGIGSAMVQLVKHFGGDITAVCNTKNIELVKSLGANRVIDYTKDDFTKDTERFDFVFDSVGKSSFGKCKTILKPGGVYISSELGKRSENLLFSLTTAIFGSMPGSQGKKVKFPYPPDRKRSVLLIKKLFEEGKYKSVIDRTFSLERIADAFNYVLKGQKTGNVVITVGDDAGI